MATGLIPDTTPAHSHDAAYVNVTGDTMTGNLTIAPLTGTGTRVVEVSSAGAVSAGPGPDGSIFLGATPFSAVASVSVDNCFTSAFRNYRLIVSIPTATVTGGLSMRLRAAGVDTSSANYDRFVIFGQALANTVSGSGSLAQTSWFPGNMLNGSPASGLSMDIFAPQLAEKTTATSHQVAYDSATDVIVAHDGMGIRLTTQFDGFTLFVASGTITGTVRVYGYRNS